MSNLNDKKQKECISDFNLLPITTKQYSEHLELSFITQSDVFVFGRRGIGKTKIPEKLIADKGYEMVKLNLSVLERPDMGGYPDPFSSGDFVKFKMMELFKKMVKSEENNKPVVALLDEVDKTDPSVWGPLLQFIQDRKVNNHTFDNLICTVSTGNLISEGGSKPCAPLLDRGEKYLLQVSTEEWLDWAAKEANPIIHPSIRAFIQENPDYLVGSVDVDENYSSESPRGWNLASNTIIKLENYWNNDISEAHNRCILEKISGFVGKKTGKNFELYYKFYRKLLPYVDDIFKDKLEDVKKVYNDLSPSEKLVISMMAATRLTSYIKNINDNSTNYNKYVKNRFRDFTLDLNKTTPLQDPEMEKLRKAIYNLGNFFSKVVDQEEAYITIRSQIGKQVALSVNLYDHNAWADLVNNINTNLSVAG